MAETDSTKEKNDGPTIPERPRVFLKHGSHSMTEKTSDELPGTSTSSCSSGMSRSVSCLPQKGNCDRPALDSRTPSQGTNKILGEILRNQRVILATLAEHGEILHNLQMSYKDAEKNAQPEGWPARMPLSCLQELDEWESFLKHEDNHSFAVDYFSRVGGDSCSEMCRRILRKLFSVGLSGKLNIQGSEKKKGLRSTATLKVIQSACCKYFPDVAHANVDKETVYAIGKWLRNQCPKK